MRADLRKQAHVVHGTYSASILVNLKEHIPCLPGAASPPPGPPAHIAMIRPAGAEQDEMCSQRGFTQAHACTHARTSPLNPKEVTRPSCSKSLIFEVQCLRACIDITNADGLDGT